MLYDTKGIAYDLSGAPSPGVAGQEGGGPWQPLWDLIRKFSLPNKFLNFTSNEFK